MPVQDFVCLLTFIEDAIEENVERLSECGSDKMFQNLSAVFRILFGLLSRSRTISQAEEMVRALHSSALNQLNNRLHGNHFCNKQPYNLVLGVPSPSYRYCRALPESTTQSFAQCMIINKLVLSGHIDCWRPAGVVLHITYLAEEAAAAAAQVSGVQCKFVLQMLSYSNFSKHLSAVRETNALVKRALDLAVADHGAAMERVKQWLQQHNIVGQLLRANLHQKQYVEQVRYG